MGRDRGGDWGTALKVRVPESPGPGPGVTVGVAAAAAKEEAAVLLQW